MGGHNCSPTQPGSVLLLVTRKKRDRVEELVEELMKMQMKKPHEEPAIGEPSPQDWPKGVGISDKKTPKLIQKKPSPGRATEGPKSEGPGGAREDEECPDGRPENKEAVAEQGATLSKREEA